MNYLIIGFERSGISATSLLINKKQNVFVYDSDNKKYQNAQGNKAFEKVTFVKKLSAEMLKTIDICVVSPAVRLDSEIMQKIYRMGIKVIGELELGVLFCRGELLAITGTNGKTTAVTLLGDIIKGSKTVGNIGEPITSHTKDKKLVAEVSSFQLVTIDKFRPHIAGITYIDSDHLDYHKTKENYIKAKYNIAKNMGRKDYLVLNSEDPISMHLALETKAKVYAFSLHDECKGAYVKDGKIYFVKRFRPRYVMDTKDIKLYGEHNLANVLLCITMARLAGVPIKRIRQQVSAFRGLEHRLEEIANIGNVTYIDDSKATNISATLVALKSVKGSTILLAGGSDKGYEYDELVQSLNVKKLIIFGAVKDKLIQACKRNNFDNYAVADKLFDAVELAKSIAKDGDIVLLSPASASHDEFKNYIERGEKFEEYVLYRG